MAGKAEIILGVINNGATVGAAATSVADQFLVNNSGMVLLNQTAQAGAVIASVTSVTKLVGPYVPIINMPANIVAGTITFLKIGIDVKAGRELKSGDVVSLVGNVAGVIGTMTILVGASPWIIGFFTLVSVGAGLYSIRNSEVFSKVVKSAGDFFKKTSSNNYLDYMCAPDLRIVNKGVLKKNYANKMLSCHWMSTVGKLLLSSLDVPGGTRSVMGAVIPPAPLIIPRDHDVGNVKLKLVINGNTYDAGDQYGCCTGTSDGYF